MSDGQQQLTAIDAALAAAPFMADAETAIGRRGDSAARKPWGTFREPGRLRCLSHDTTLVDGRCPATRAGREVAEPCRFFEHGTIPL